MQLMSRVSRSNNIYPISCKTAQFSEKSKGNIHGRTVSHRFSNGIHKRLVETQNLPFIQRRHYSQKFGDTPNILPEIGTNYFKENGFNELQVEQIKKSTDGVTFRVISIAEKSHEDIKTTDRFINLFFKNVIQSHPDSSALGGEKVLLFNPAKPEQGKPDSSFLMAFNGEQDPHFHGGPRHLDMWSSKPWTVMVGGSDAKVLSDDEIHFTKIEFPPGHVSLSFKKGMLHGFSGEGIGAISTHWTDAEELAVVRSQAGLSSDASANDLMGTLTKFVDKEKIRIIGGQSIPWYAISNLQATPKPDDL